jgi:hypothetical protein
VRAQDRVARERASAPTMKAGPTPAAAIPRGDGTVISDSEDDSSVDSGSSESEGGVGNNDAYDNNDDGSLPPQVNIPEGAPPAAPNIDAGPPWSGCQRKPRERLIESCNIRAVKALYSNFEFHADKSCNIRAVEALSSNFEFRASCPNYVWRPGSDGKLERFNLWTFQQSLTRLDKLNQDIFTLTFGKKNIPPMALKLSKKKKRLK